MQPIVYACPRCDVEFETSAACRAHIATCEGPQPAAPAQPGYLRALRRAQGWEAPC